MEATSTPLASPAKQKADAGEVASRPSPSPSAADKGEADSGASPPSPAATVKTEAQQTLPPPPASSSSLMSTSSSSSSSSAAAPPVVQPSPSPILPFFIPGQAAGPMGGVVEMANQELTRAMYGGNGYVPQYYYDYTIGGYTEPPPMPQEQWEEYLRMTRSESADGQLMQGYQYADMGSQVQVQQSFLPYAHPPPPPLPHPHSHPHQHPQGPGSPALPLGTHQLYPPQFHYPQAIYPPPMFPPPPSVKPNEGQYPIRGGRGGGQGGRGDGGHGSGRGDVSGLQPLQQIQIPLHTFGGQPPTNTSPIDMAQGYSLLPRILQSPNALGRDGGSREAGGGGERGRGRGRGWTPGRGRGRVPNGASHVTVNGGVGNDVSNEQNRGPRTNRGRGGRGGGIGDSAQGGSRGEGRIGEGVELRGPGGEEFNKADFPVVYETAKFFVIKSYSEDDVHKSIKYKVWASTPNGNKGLDAAFSAAKSAAENGNGTACPVFLFFSVNASGQFCGVAEMTSNVDFTRSVEYWQADKWNGQFSVKWHLVKDIPNSNFRHIIIASNDGKPVTNSRDTQEVGLQQGLEMLSIFKKFPGRTSILDDFSFYDERQKVLQERKLFQQQMAFQLRRVGPGVGFFADGVGGGGAGGRGGGGPLAGRPMMNSSPPLLSHIPPSMNLPSTVHFSHPPQLAFPNQHLPPQSYFRQNQPQQRFSAAMTAPSHQLQSGSTTTSSAPILGAIPLTDPATTVSRHILSNSRLQPSSVLPLGEKLVNSTDTSTSMRLATQDPLSEVNDIMQNTIAQSLSNLQIEGAKGS